MNQVKNSSNTIRTAVCCGISLCLLLSGILLSGAAHAAPGDTYPNSAGTTSIPAGLYVSGDGYVKQLLDPANDISSVRMTAQQCDSGINKLWAANLAVGNIDGKNVIMTGPSDTETSHEVYSTDDGGTTIKQLPNISDPPTSSWNGSALTPDGAYWNTSASLKLYPNSQSYISRSDPATGKTVISNKITPTIPEDRWGSMYGANDIASSVDGDLYGLFIDRAANNQVWIYRYNTADMPNVTVTPVVSVTGPVVGPMRDGGAFDINGFAWHDGKWWAASRNGRLYSIDPLTGVSAQSPNTIPEDGGCSFPDVLDLGSTEFATVLKPKLEISKTADKPKAYPGDTVTYTVTVKNTGNGSSFASPFGSVTDDMSKVIDKADYNNDGKASVGDVMFTSPKLRWIGGLGPGESVTITYSVKVKAGVKAGDMTNVVVPPNGIETNCEECRSTIAVTPLKLEILKTADNLNPQAGDTVTYTVDVKNTTEADAGTAVFAGPLVDDMSKVLDKADYNHDTTASTGQVSFNTPKLTWNGSLPAGETLTLTYSVKVKDDVKAGEQLANVVVPPDGADTDCISCRLVVTTPLANTGASSNTGLMLKVGIASLAIGLLLLLNNKRIARRKSSL